MSRDHLKLVDDEAPRLTPEEQEMADKSLEQLLLDAEEGLVVDLWNLGMRVGEFSKGHLVLNILPALKSNTLKAVKDFHRRSNKPVLKVTEVKLNLLVKESFLIGGLKPVNDEAGQAQGSSLTAPGEPVVAAFERAFAQLEEWLPTFEETLEEGRKYKATFSAKWSWPK